MASKRLSVIIPVFNEAGTIASVVERVSGVPIDIEIVLVDDGSFDGTPEIVGTMVRDNVKILRHSVRRGKGAAVRTGLSAATGDSVIIQDADFEYDPQDFIALIEPVNSGRADVVYGVRSLENQKRIMKWGNRFLTGITNLLYGQKLRDMETCYKVMRREIALGLDLESDGFDIEPEITAKVLRSGYTIYEVPISYVPRYENKKLSPLDGIPTLIALLKYRYWKPSSGGRDENEQKGQTGERPEMY